MAYSFPNEINKVQKTYEMRRKKTRESLDKRRKEEIKTIEERKHVMIDHLMAVLPFPIHKIFKMYLITFLQFIFRLLGTSESLRRH